MLMCLEETIATYPADVACDLIPDMGVRRAPSGLGYD